MKKKTNKLRILYLAALIVVCALFIIVLTPVFLLCNDSEKLSLYIESFGMWGAFVLLAIQILQIVVAIIPGEFTEFASGTLYGTFFGSLICLTGIFIGELIIFILVKWFGNRFAQKMTKEKEFKKLKFLNDEKKLEYTIFLLFFIPGTPKDALTYFVPMTKIDMKRFLILSTIARIPTVVSSAYAGSTFAEGNFLKTLLVYIIIGAISITGLYIHHRLFNKGEKNGR